MLQENFILTELDRRISNLLRLGRISVVKEDKVKVEIGKVETNWLPWLTSRAGNDITWWSPDVGEQVLVLSPEGDFNQAVVLPAIYQKAFRPASMSKDVCSVQYEDGTKVSYDKLSHHLDINVNGSISLKVGSSELQITKDGIKLNAPKIELN